MEWAVSVAIFGAWLAVLAVLCVRALSRRVMIGYWALPRSQVLRIVSIVAAAGTLALLWVWCAVWSILRVSGALGSSEAWVSWMDLPFIRWPLLATLAALPFVVLYGRYCEPRWLSTTHLYGHCSSSAGEAHGASIRIAVISDLHVGQRSPGAWKGLADAVNAVSPDAVLLLGDLLNEEDSLEELRQLLSDIAAPPAGKWAVRGNWDVWYWNHLELLEGTGFSWLDERAVHFSEKGVSVRLVGVPFSHHDEETAAAALSLFNNDRQQTQWKILACHIPDPFDHVAAGNDCDLMLSGHTHGGQVWIPGVGPVAMLSRHGVKYSRGLHRLGSTWLYVNSGIGVEPALPFRIMVRPELTVIHLPQRMQNGTVSFRLPFC